MNECGAQPITHSSYYYIDGLGYYDDGEDRLGDEAAEEEGRTNKKRAGSTANITAAALKRARKTKAMLLEKKKLGQDDSTKSSNKGQMTMWDFAQRGASSVASSHRQLQIEHPTTTTTTRPHLETTCMGDLDSLIDGLDSAVPSKKSSSTSG
jgi:hypothetical protein